MKHIRLITAAAGVWLCFSSVTAMASCMHREPSYEDRETFAQETYVTMENTDMTLLDGLTMELFPANTPEGKWLEGCSAPDRNDQLDAYILRHEFREKEHTTFTYLVYYPHGGSAMQAKPVLMEGEGGYAIRLSYVGGEGNDRYSLCLLTVTLPTDKAPRLSLQVGEDSLGYISTVTATPIARME